MPADPEPSFASDAAAAAAPAFGVDVAPRPDPAEVFAAFCGAGLWVGLGRTTAARLPAAGVRLPADVAPSRLTAVEGMTPARARRLYDTFTEAAPVYRAVELLVAANLPARLARGLRDEFGPATVTALREDPWALLTPGDADLPQADRLARSMGCGRDDPRRGPAVVVHLLARAAKGAGDTAGPIADVLRAAARDGVLDPVAALRTATTDGRVIVTGELAALDRFTMAEQAVAEGIERLVATAGPLRRNTDRASEAAAPEPDVEPAPHPETADMFADVDSDADGDADGDHDSHRSHTDGDDDGGSSGDDSDDGDKQSDVAASAAAEAALRAALDGLDEVQAQAARTVLDAGVSVLTGGPGTGKSRTVAAVVQLARLRDARIALAAPTGRAAKRLEELCEAPATTLHRLLQAQGRSGGFARDEHNPIEADLVVVDEASMLDAELAAALLDACADGTHLLVVGDPAQLPSIGPGRVLADLIESELVPVTELRRLYRQSEGGSIATMATSVRGGELPPPPADAGREVVVVPARSSGEAAHRTVQLVTDSIPRALGIPAAEVQVVTPVHGGPAGTTALNAALKRALNPGAGATNGFDPGDRVVATANHLDVGFANGEIGVVAAPGAKGGLLVEFPAGVVEVPSGVLGDLRHGWAVTVHRAQGSEWPAVVVVFPPEAGRMLTRPLVYTAITRAQRHLSVVSVNGPALRHAVRQSGGRRRCTLLPGLLAGVGAGDSDFAGFEDLDGTDGMPGTAGTAGVEGMTGVQGMTGVEGRGGLALPGPAGAAGVTVTARTGA